MKWDEGPVLRALTDLIMTEDFMRFPIGILKYLQKQEKISKSEIRFRLARLPFTGNKLA